MRCTFICFYFAFLVLCMYVLHFLIKKLYIIVATGPSHYTQIFISVSILASYINNYFSPNFIDKCTFIWLFPVSSFSLQATRLTKEQVFMSTASVDESLRRAWTDVNLKCYRNRMSVMRMWGCEICCWWQEIHPQDWAAAAFLLMTQQLYRQTTTALNVRSAVQLHRQSCDASETHPKKNNQSSH